MTDHEARLLRMATERASPRYGLRVACVVTRSTPWPRPLMPIALVIPRPEMTRVPSSKTKLSRFRNVDTAEWSMYLLHIETRAAMTDDHEDRLLRMAGMKTPKGFLLPDAVRVECQGVWSHRDCKSMSQCQNLLADNSALPRTTDCQGRGWVPSTDPMVWTEVLWPALRDVEPIVTLWINAYAVQFLNGFFPAALEAAERGLVAAGTLKKVPDGGA